MWQGLSFSRLDLQVVTEPDGINSSTITRVLCHVLGGGSVVPKQPGSQVCAWPSTYFQPVATEMLSSPSVYFA